MIELNIWDSNRYCFEHMLQDSRGLEDEEQTIAQKARAKMFSMAAKLITLEGFHQPLYSEAMDEAVLRLRGLECWFNWNLCAMLTFEGNNQRPSKLRQLFLELTWHSGSTVDFEWMRELFEISMNTLACQS